MKQLFTLLTLACLGLAGPAAQAQYTFTDANLNPYQQNFNSLQGGSAWQDNTTLPGVYLAARLTKSNYPTAGQTFTYDVTYAGAGTVPANDGSNTTAAYFHFGYGSGTGSEDRALGGIASPAVIAGGLQFDGGVGYVAIRFKIAVALPFATWK